VIRRHRHASAEELASLGVGELRARKTARIEAHVVGCVHCTRVLRQLDGLPAVLASASYPPMPETISVRIEATLAVEARQRIAAEPATEAGRGDLPTRQRRGGAWEGWRMPGLSVAATRLVAAAGALVLVGAGGYELAMHTGSGLTTSPSAGSAAGPAQVQQMNQGPQITYGGPKAQHTVHAVQSGANFVAASLSTQATDAVHAAEARGTEATPPAFGAPGAAKAQSNTSAGAATGPRSAGRLSGCLNLIAAARTVLLVDIANYEHKPATLIVLAAAGASPAEAWVVGDTCSATDRDVLAHTVLSHL
jgi:hypothetical protein